MIDLDDLLPAPAAPLVAEPEAKQLQQVDALPETRNPPRRVVSSKGVMHFDLETIPDYERMPLFDLPSIPEPSKRSNADACPAIEAMLKGSLDEFKQYMQQFNPSNEVLDAIDAKEKTAAKTRKGVFDVTSELRRQDATREELISAQRKQMSVTPEMCKIVALGYLVDNGVPHSLIVGTDGRTERDLLIRFWSVASGSKKLCGFNVLGFDLPVIFTRSILLDVAPTRQIDLKPWGNDVIDLMAKRWPKGPATGLKKLARMLGIEVPAGDVDGSQTEQLLKDDPTKLGEYVRSDVYLCDEIFRRYSGFFF